MSPHRHSVLVVDDDVDALDTLSTSLALGDVVAHAVSSGHEALSLLAGGLRPCAILLDVRMPALDGWRVRDRLREIPGADHIPIVLVSAEMPDRGRAEAAGVFMWLRKPVGIAQLDGVLRACCPATVSALVR